MEEFNSHGVKQHQLWRNINLHYIIRYLKQYIKDKCHILMYISPFSVVYTFLVQHYIHLYMHVLCIHCTSSLEVLFEEYIYNITYYRFSY